MTCQTSLRDLAGPSHRRALCCRANKLQLNITARSHGRQKYNTAEYYTIRKCSISMQLPSRFAPLVQRAPLVDRNVLAASLWPTAKIRRQRERGKKLLYLELQSPEKIWGLPAKQTKTQPTKWVFPFGFQTERLTQKLRRRQNECKTPQCHFYKVPL